MGRPRKPTALKHLENHRDKRPFSGAEPRPGGVESMKPPSWLSKRGRAVWRRVSPEVARMGLLTAADTDAFACWCQSVADYQEASEALDREGAVVMNGPQYAPSPWHSIRAKALAGLVKLSGRFGMTPADRAGMCLAVAAELDEFDQFEIENARVAKERGA